MPWFIGPAYLGIGYLAWVVATVLGDVRRNSPWLTTIGTQHRSLCHDRLGPVKRPRRLDHQPNLDVRERRRLLRRAPGQLPGLDLHRLPVHPGLRPLLAQPLPAATAEPDRATASDLQGVLLYAAMAISFFFATLFNGDRRIVTDATGTTWRTGDI